MTASEIAANVIFSAGWVAVGAAAMYSRRKRAAREAEAARAAAPPEEVRHHAVTPGPHLQTVWTSDLVALASAIDHATVAPEMKPEIKHARAGQSQ